MLPYFLFYYVNALLCKGSCTYYYVSRKPLECYINSSCQRQYRKIIILDKNCHKKYMCQSETVNTFIHRYYLHSVYTIASQMLRELSVIFIVVLLNSLN